MSDQDDNPQPTEEQEPCPRCGGTGTIMATPGGGFAFNPGNRMYPTICSRCAGTGKIRKQLHG